jgi:hypothetical protein
MGSSGDVDCVPFAASNVRAPDKASTPAYRSENAWTDLGLTLPIFLTYHLCVVFLPVHNAADLVTHKMAELAAHDLVSYAGLTLAIGTAMVLSLVALGRGHSLRLSRFLGIATEGVIYAVALRVVASTVVGRLRLDGAVADAASLASQSTFAGVVLSLGAGFYEELVFRVGIFAVLGRIVSLALLASPLPFTKLFFWLGWSLASAAAFSAWHHFGQFGEPFALQAFVFRWVSGLLFTLIFALRGFAPAVWTHTLYDIWVLVL